MESPGESYMHPVKLISALHFGMKPSVPFKGDLSDDFGVNNGVKQGYAFGRSNHSLWCYKHNAQNQM